MGFGSSEGWLSRLKKGLDRTRVNIVGLFSGGVVDEDFLEELEFALITADIGVDTSSRILQRLRDEIKLKGLRTQEEVRRALRDQIEAILAPSEVPFDVERPAPLVMMMTGVNGAGKTTTIGKLSKFFAAEGKTVLLAAGDTFRAAAREQLAVWGERNRIDVISQEGGDPAAVAFDAVNAGKARGIHGLRVTVDGPESAGKMTPPTKLKNPWWSRPFEFFVEMYGLPAYGETDVTGFVAITFTVLFGMMFGDVGQGIVLALFSTFMWKVKHNDLFHLMIPCGISSTIFGLVYGSLFGYEEALDPLYHALGMAGKPVSVMDSITGILMVAVYIGIVLVLAAMALNMYTHARHREWGEFIFSPNGLVGMVTYLCGVNLASAYMGAVTFMPQVLAVVGMVIGLVLLLFAELLAPMVEGKPWKPAGGMGNYLMQSVFELLETVLSYLSNTISFLRVGAFVIVHASMMMVVFTLAGTPNNIVVVILGNLVVICLEALLSAIQGIRLEFYEMFSRCYKGGGRKFVAFDLKKAKA